VSISNTALALSAIVLFGSMVSATPAVAHDGGATSCVTQHEWRHVQAGMRKARVHAIFDTTGRFVDGFAGGYARRYRPCAWNRGTDVSLYVPYNGFTRRVSRIHRGTLPAVESGASTCSRFSDAPRLPEEVRSPLRMSLVTLLKWQPRIAAACS